MRRASAVSSTSRAASRASTTDCGVGRGTRPTATRRGRERPSWRRSRPSTRPRSTVSSTSAERASTPSACPAATGSSTVCSRTTAISRSGRTSRCGKRRSGCGPTHERRTAPSSRSRPGCARPVASSMTSRRRRPTGCAAARALRRRRQARLLPALRRRDGADAADARHPGPRRRRVHQRHLRGRRLDRDRPQRPCLGRGLVPRTTAGCPSTRLPRRGSLAASYSASSSGFNAGDAADGFLGGATRVNGGGADQLRLLAQKEQLAEQAQASRARRRRGPERGCGCSSCSLSQPSSRSASPSSSGGAAATSHAIRGVWPARPGASSSTSSPTRESPSA